MWCFHAVRARFPSPCTAGFARQGPGKTVTGSGKAKAVRVAILAGIDEAGFGPLLGPLMVSCSAFSVEPGLLEADLWQTFKRSVGKTRRHLAGRLLIADSKKAFDRAGGLGHLERTVLAVLRMMGAEMQDLTSLLDVLCPECLPRLAEYPWYQDLHRWRLTEDGGRRTGDGVEGTDLGSRDTGDERQDAASMRIASNVFEDDLQTHGAKLVHMQSRCLDVAYYNRMVSQVRNKSQVLFIATTQLVQGLLDRFSEDNVRILVDRQGGRAHYREHLLRSFPGMDLRIVAEGSQSSIYELRAGARTVRLSFTVGADECYLPVSLASMVSKYVRELLMRCVNEYFVGMDAGLKPTAGYWKDGLRFVEELRHRLPQVEIDRERLIRSR